MSNASIQLYHLEENRTYYQSIYERCQEMRTEKDDVILPATTTSSSSQETPGAGSGQA